MDGHRYRECRRQSAAARRARDVVCSLDQAHDPVNEGEVVYAAAEAPRRVRDVVRSLDLAHDPVNEGEVVYGAAAEAPRPVGDVVRSLDLAHDPVNEGGVVYGEHGELVRGRRRGRRMRRNPNSESSSSSVTGRSAGNPGAGTAIHVRQSVLYSNRPRVSGSRGRRELSPNKLLSNLPYDTDSSDPGSEIVEDNPSEESDFDLEKELQEWREYCKENTSDTISEGMDKILAVERATLAAEFDKMSAAEHSDMTARSSYFSPAASDAQSLEATEQTSSAKPSWQRLLRRQPRREVSEEEIIQNGKNWMNKEVMLAFDNYKKITANLKGLDCQLEELCHQCFNVENYNKIFHHYNFSVKITDLSSSDSRVALFFAEVKEIFGKANYFCCPLEKHENGQCHACHNQGMDDLQHPATGGYDQGSTDTVFPFMYMDECESC